MSNTDYPVLKLRCDSIIPHNVNISLDGIPLKGIRGIKFSSHVNNDVNLVQIELLAKVDIESPVEVTKDLVTYIDGVKYKLVKAEDTRNKYGFLFSGPGA